MPRRIILEFERLEKSAEVDALKRLHGFTLAEACRVVMLHPNAYVAGQHDCGWLPSPHDIEAASQAIRSGELILDSTAIALKRSEDQRQKSYDLADSLPEDAVVYPHWFTMPGTMQ